MWISKVLCKLLESYFDWLIGKGPYPGGFLYGNREWIKIVFRWNHEARDLISSGLPVSCNFYKQLSRSLPWRLIRTGCEKISQECKQQLKASSRYIKHLHPVNAIVTHKLQVENAVQGEWQAYFNQSNRTKYTCHTRRQLCHMQPTTPWMKIALEPHLLEFPSSQAFSLHSTHRDLQLSD